MQNIKIHRGNCFNGLLSRIKLCKFKSGTENLSNQYNSMLILRSMWITIVDNYNGVVKYYKL